VARTTRSFAAIGAAIGVYRHYLSNVRVG